MALRPIKLPQLQARIPIVDAKGMPTAAFVRYWNIDVIGSIEAAINGIIDFGNDLAEVQEIQEQEIARLNSVVFAAQQTNAAAQAAVQAANQAQQTADEALANGTVSGSAMDPAIDVSGASWVLGPQVDLTGVVAGTLTISGSGPQQDEDVQLISGPISRSFSGEFRIVEVVSGVDTVLATFSFSAFQDVGDASAFVSNDSVSSVSAFSASRSTTGAVSYRIDARKTGGTSNISSLLLYIYARRAA